MKYADLVGEWLIELGYTHCFFVAGGGTMHLLDSFRKRFACVSVVHEVAAGICVEHFNECSTGHKRAFALVTTGPGLTNIVTAVAGCYVDHRELLVLAGQVKSTDLLTYPQRQRGVQEVDGSAICQPISVASRCLTAPISEDEFKSLCRSSQGPHPGPVVIEICLDVQGAAIDSQTRSDIKIATCHNILSPSSADITYLTTLLAQARRPMILLGGLVSRDAARNALPVFEKLRIPVATTTSAIDRIPSNSPVFAGRPGTWGGQRAANLLVAQADVLVVLGAQLDLQQTGFNYQKFAPNAHMVHVFPSTHELNRPGPPAVRKVFASPDEVIRALLPELNWQDRDEWCDYVNKLRAAIPPIEPSNVSRPGFINSFHFLRDLSRAADSSDILALCSSGGTFTGALQNYEIAQGQIATVSPAHASMGYGLATAIGAAFANPARRVILTEGEGGFAQNFQELAILKRYRLPIKIFLLENNGYASIRSTQKKFFQGSYIGCDPETGLSFPEWEKLFDAFNIPCRHLQEEESSENGLRNLISRSDQPEAWIVTIDPEQPNWPAVSTTLSQDGTMTSSPLYEMNPKLEPELLANFGRYLKGD
jgi:acetolactate synthase-1/2/3 large subunit